MLRMALLMAAVAAASLAAAGCGAGESTRASAATEPQHGGDLTIGMEQEPPGLNSKLVSGGTAVTSQMANAVLDSLLDVDKQGQWQPVLAVEVPTFENGLVKLIGPKLEVTMSIKDHAVWSDKHPIGCDDFKFTWQTTMDDRWLIGSRVGWEEIESVECLTPKQMRVTFRSHYALYKNVMSAVVYPEHELADKDFNKYWSRGYTLASGPFEFERWKPGVFVRLKRNENYWNAGERDLPYLDTVSFVFLKDTNTQKLQVRTGEVDVINPAPDTNLEKELKTFPYSSYSIEPSVYWEHLALNTESPPLDNVHVRRAIAYAVDRKQIVDVVLKGQVPPLHSYLLPTYTDVYEPVFEQYSVNPDKVVEEMEKAGFAKQGEWWTKDGKPVTLEFKTTAGNTLRMKNAQVIQQMLKRAGFQVTVKLEVASVFFGASANQGAFQIGEWAFSSGVDPSKRTLFTCDQIPTKPDYEGNNNYRYCNEEVTKLWIENEVTLEQDKRNDLIKQAGRIIGEEVPLIPMYQRPDTIAYTNRTHDIAHHPLMGLTWNIEEWWVDS